MEIKIEKCLNDKSQKKYLCFSIDTGVRTIKIFAKDNATFMEILDLKPSELDSLPVGVVKVFKEVK